MNKRQVAKTATLVIETMIPQEVSQWIKTECHIVVDDLSNWDISLAKKTVKGKELLGIFGFENGKPVIGLNHKIIETEQEVIKTTKHECAHFARWHLGLPNGERATTKLAHQWEGDCKL